MKVKRSIVFTVFLILGSYIGHSQDSLKRSALSLSFGVADIRNKDKFQSLYTYKGRNILINSVYEKVKAKGLHVFELTYSAGKVHSIISPEANNAIALLSYDYFFTPRNRVQEKKLTSAIGFGLHSMANRINYLPEVNLSKKYITGTAALTLSGYFNYQLSKRNKLSMRAMLPIYGLAYRPDFEINGKTLVEATNLSNSIFISGKLEYQYAINSKLGLKVSYHFNYFSFDHPRPINLLQNGITMGLVLKLK